MHTGQADGRTFARTRFTRTFRHPLQIHLHHLRNSNNSTDSMTSNIALSLILVLLIHFPSISSLVAAKRNYFYKESPGKAYILSSADYYCIRNFIELG